MAVNLFGDLDNNNIEISRKFLESSEGSITFRGVGATVRIADPLIGGCIYSTIESNASIEIGSDCVIGNLTLHAVASDSHIRIVQGVGFNGSVSISAHEPSIITIGDECLFASGCHINSSDVHHIYDAKTHERLNPAADITLGKHVWLAAGVIVMKGTNVGDMSVVGASTVLTGIYPANVLIAGIPPRVIRTGIYWKR